MLHVACCMLRFSDSIGRFDYSPKKFALSFCNSTGGIHQLKSGVKNFYLEIWWNEKIFVILHCRFKTLNKG